MFVSDNIELIHTKRHRAQIFYKRKFFEELDLKEYFGTDIFWRKTIFFKDLGDFLYHV